VSSLCNLHDNALETETTGCYPSQPESDALKLMRMMFDWDTTAALKAGIISKWLSQYPFGGLNTVAERKREIVEMMIKHEEPYSRYGEDFYKIIVHAINLREAYEEMLGYGLWDMPFRGDAARQRSDHSAWNEDGTVQSTNTRQRDESVDGQRVRRRNRNAVVIGENGRNHIFERENVNEDEEVEEGLEQLLEEVTVAGAFETSTWWYWISRLRPDGLAPLNR